MSVTIPADGEDGQHYQITLDKTAKDTGAVKINDGSYDLYAIKAANDGSKIMCNANVFGPDPKVTLALDPVSTSGKARTNRKSASSS